MKIIQITEETADEMSDLVEQMLRAGGKLMHHIDELKTHTKDADEHHAEHHSEHHHHYDDDDE